MTSPRKVKDFKEQTLRPRPRRSPTSVHKDLALLLMELEPPQGLLIDIPEGKERQAYRKLIRAVVDRMDKRSVIMVTNLVRAILTALLVIGDGSTASIFVSWNW